MPPKAAASPSFEDALSELETIVKGLESGKTTLEESITAYTRGMELKKLCEARLKDAQSRIEKITLSPDGSVGTTPFENE